MADPTFAKDVKPLFPEEDRSSTTARLDPWSCEDVRANASAILEVLQAESMPCDGPWSADNIDRFARWIVGAMAE